MPKSKAKDGGAGKGKGFASREEQSDSSGRNVFTTDLPTYKMKEKKNRLDVVEFKVKKYERNAKKGDTFHSLVYYVHPDIGPGGKTVVCPKTKGDNEPCPVCEHQFNLFRTKGKEIAKPFRNKKRIAQLVVDRDDKSKGLQLFSHAYNKGYGEALEKRLNGDDEGKYDNWSDAKKGYFVSFLGTSESVGDDGGSWVTTATVDLEERTKPLDPKLVKSAPSLDDLLDSIPSADKLKKMIAGKAKDEDDDEGSEDDEEEDDNEEDEDGSDSEADEDDGEEDEEDDEDEDDESEEDDEDEEALEKGDKVSHGKGKKKREGVIVKLKGENANVKFGKKIEEIPLDELTAVEDDEEDDEELDDDSDIEDDDDEEDDDFEADDDDEDEDDDEDDDDDDDDDEEATSKPRRRKK